LRGLVGEEVVVKEGERFKARDSTGEKKVGGGTESNEVVLHWQPP
jgi:hypothetical protein